MTSQQQNSNPKLSDIDPELKHGFLFSFQLSVPKSLPRNEWSPTAEVFQAAPSSCFPIGADLAQAYSHGAVLFPN